MLMWPAVVNKVLLALSYACLFRLYQWLLSYGNSRVELLQQRLRGSRTLNHLPSGPL